MITDPIEIIVADALNAASIAFTHESENKSQRLDFLLSASGVYIECKQFPTERTSQQIKPFSDVILIQGRQAAKTFAALINASKPVIEMIYSEPYDWRNDPMKNDGNGY